MTPIPLSIEIQKEIEQQTAWLENTLNQSDIRIEAQLLQTDSEDTSGPTTCRVRLTLATALSLNTEAWGATPSEAITRAFDRMTVHAVRSLAWVHTHRTHRKRRPLE